MNFFKVVDSFYIVMEYNLYHYKIKDKFELPSSLFLYGEECRYHIGANMKLLCLFLSRL